MKKILSFILFIFLTLNFLASPFYFFNIQEKGQALINKSDFKKIKVKTDSVILKVSHNGSNSKSTASHYIYYDKDKLIRLQDNPKRLFHSKTKLRNTRITLKYIEQHNDSVLIWYHPNYNGQIAFPKEQEMNTNGYLVQITLNAVLLVLAVSTLMWFIWKIKNKKNE